MFKDISYLEILQPFCSAEQNHLFNFGRGYHEEQFCDFILNLDQWFRRRCVLKIFLFWRSGDHFVQQSRTICAILVEGIMRNNSAKLFLRSSKLQLLSFSTYFFAITFLSSILAKWVCDKKYSGTSPPTSPNGSNILDAAGSSVLRCTL